MQFIQVLVICIRLTQLSVICLSIQHIPSFRLCTEMMKNRDERNIYTDHEREMEMLSSGFNFGIAFQIEKQPEHNSSAKK